MRRGEGEKGGGRREGAERHSRCSSLPLHVGCERSLLNHQSEYRWRRVQRAGTRRQRTLYTRMGRAGKEVGFLASCIYACIYGRFRRGGCLFHFQGQSRPVGRKQMCSMYVRPMSIFRGSRVEARKQNGWRSLFLPALLSLLSALASSCLEAILRSAQPIFFEAHI